MRRIVLPQALRRMLPALTNRGIEIFKMTTLASAVAYVELLQQGKLLASLNFNPIETYTVIAVVFFLLPLPAGAGDLCAGAAAGGRTRVRTRQSTRRVRAAAARARPATSASATTPCCAASTST